MLRLPKFQVLTPKTLDAAAALLAEHGERAMLIAGGTDLVPNMKHELFTPDVVISLQAIPELTGIRQETDGTLVIGAMTTLATLAGDSRIVSGAPALAQAAGLVAGPQLRRMGTLGGNVMLDTRCQWYNQSHFWRQALGYCMKKDGTVCHVVAGGKKCVAAASNDSAPALMTLGAELVFRGPDGEHTLPIDELWLADGIYNKRVQGEVLTEVRIPPQAAGHRGAYGKLRDRGSIDFPLFGVAVRLDLDPSGRVSVAAGGRVHQSERATSWSPAPRAKTVSVSGGERLTTRAGPESSSAGSGLSACTPQAARARHTRAPRPAAIRVLRSTRPPPARVYRAGRVGARLTALRPRSSRRSPAR